MTAPVHLATRLGAILVFAFVCAASAASAQAACPNEAIRETQTSAALPKGTVELPACMALELASPPKKFGQETGEASAFSADGNRLQFSSKAALGETPGLQSFEGDNYVAIRGAGGWTTAATSPPASARILVAGIPHAFSADLGGWVSFGATQSQSLAGEGHLFKGGLGGIFEPLSPLLEPIDNSGLTLEFSGFNFRTAATATDLSATVFQAPLSTTAFAPGDPRGIGGGDANLYLAALGPGGEPSLALLARDKADKVWGGRCGSRLGGGFLNQGAISPDASRIYLSTRPAQEFDEAKVGSSDDNPACSTANALRILERTETPAGPEIAELIPGGPSAAGDDRYQAASLDGTKVFLASPRDLAASDQDSSAEACGASIGASKGCDLYLYDAGLPPAERLIQVSAGGSGDPTPGEGADVLTSVTAISPDGSHAYFAAQGVLTTDLNPEGKAAVAGKPNLYLYERDGAHPSGHTAFLATLAAGDSGRLWGVEKSFVGNAYAVPLLGGEEGGDGHVLLLDSQASLTAEDQDGGHADVFRYDSQAQTLQCVSCAPGGPDSAPFDAAVNPNTDNAPSSNFAEKGRWASEDGQTVAFATAEPLVESDEDGAINSYLWREGELARLPGEVKIPQHQPIVSPDGGEVGFTSSERLLAVDGDGARDAYVARVDGGFPNPVLPVPCNPLSEGACQGVSSVPAPAPAVATASFVGPGDPSAAPSCKKDQVRKRGKCRKAHQKKHKKHQRASHKRKGSK